MSEPLSSRVRQWHRAWQKRTDKERNLFVAGAGLLLIAIHGLVIHPLGSKKIDKLTYDLEKMTVRNKNLAKADATPVIPPPALMGKNPTEAERELRELQHQLESISNELRSLKAQFVPLDDSLAMNALKSGLTSLAEDGDMEVTAIQHVVPRKEDADKPPTPEILKESAQSNPFRRPLIEMRARASFRGLMQFLDGLSRLPYVAAPVASSITVVVERNPQTNAPIRQWLDVRIKFAV